MSLVADLDAAGANARLAAAGAASRLTLAAEVDSTNRWAMDEAGRGAAHLGWFAADAQTAGRGRLGRAWISPPGKNLYVSVVLRPAFAPARAPQAGLAAALAVQQAAARLGVSGARVKWPNDVHVAGKKLAGILSEVKATEDRIEALVVGIGVNVAMDEADFPPDLLQPATSLRLAGSGASRTDAFVALALAFEALYGRLAAGGFAALRDEWNAADALRGRPVVIDGAGGPRAGTAAGVDDDGFLLLETAAGIEAVVAGDVTVRK